MVAITLTDGGWFGSARRIHQAKPYR